MTSRPSNLGASVFEYIRREARKRKRDVQAEAQSYAIRRFIARLMDADVDGRASIKGGQSYGLLFGNDRRPTKDLDLSINSDGLDDPDGWVKRLIEATCADVDDGVAYRFEDVQIERRKHQGVGGYRMTIRSTIHTCRTDFVVDVGMTDTLVFKPTKAVLETNYPHEPKSPTIRVYPYEATFAEKLLSKVEDGVSSIRHKDFWDMWHVYKITTKIGDLGHLTAPSFDLPDGILAWREEVLAAQRDGGLLELPDVDVTDDCIEYFAYALYRLAVARKTKIPSDLMGFLRTNFAEDPHQSTQYANWLKNTKQRLTALPQASNSKSNALGIVLDEIDSFVSRVADRALCLDDIYGSEAPTFEQHAKSLSP